MSTISDLWMWVGFIIFVLIMLSIDMFLMGGKKAHRVSIRESLGWVIVWVSLALLFNVLLWWYLSITQDALFAKEKALEFLTGYLIEESLSVDNMFVFLMLFKHFAVPHEYQRRILLYGVLGAIVMRLIMILSGIWLVEKFEWLLFVFGAFLVFTGIKMFRVKDENLPLEDRKILKWIYRRFNVTETIESEDFFIIKNNTLFMTPLFITLMMIEFSDLIFALDSIPAIFAITKDPFIVFTSNIFAILGLRSLYFLLAHMADRFYYLKYGLAIILVFVGTKMLIIPWVKVPIVMALLFIAVVLITSAVMSFIISKHKQVVNKHGK